MSAGGPGRTGPDEAADPAAHVVVAAGGIVLDGSGSTQRVLVVHRPAYDDWSLPKGHVDPGEDLAAAALREVLEETGVAATVVSEAGTTEHPVRIADRDARKRVHWFVLTPVDDHRDPAERAPDTEVDRAAWWTTARALTDLTYAGERTLLQRTLRRA
jgi:8-oxo-dGTP diphosphatase